MRYDGIYRIAACWRKPGNQGPLMCRYLFVRADNEPAPWSTDGMSVLLSNTLGMLPACSAAGDASAPAVLLFTDGGRILPRLLRRTLLVGRIHACK